MSRLLAAMLLAAACPACDPKPASPFVGTATPELRAIVTKLCADPVTGASDNKTEHEGYNDAVAQSSGYGCSVRLEYDPRDLHIRYLTFGAGMDWNRARTFLRDTVLRIVKPHIRAWIETNVLADFGADKHLSYSELGKGEVYYHNRTRDGFDHDLRPVRQPMLSLDIGWK